MRKLYLSLVAVCYCCCQFVYAQQAQPTRDDLREQGILADPGEVIFTEDPGQSGQSVLKTDACPASFVLSTPYNTNNGQRGAMFDIYATNAVTILCFDFNLYSGTTADYEIYYRAGTHVGNENNAGAWTFIGSTTALTSAGNNVPTAIPIPVNVNIPAGQRYAFYVTNTVGGGTSYTDGAAVGNFLAGDANITVYEGVGKSYPFGITFTVRKINAHIYYDATVLDNHDLGLEASAGHTAVQLSMHATGAEYSRFELMRSTQNGDYVAVANFEGSLPDTYVDENVAAGELYLYRLDGYAADGALQSSPVVSASLTPDAEWSIASVAPNPFADGVMLNLYLAKNETAEVALFNTLGQEVLRSRHELGMGYQSLQLPVEHLEKGVYILQVNINGRMETRRLVHQ